MKRIDYKSEKRHDYNKFIKSLREYNKDTYGDKPIRKGIQLYHALKSIFNPDRCVFLTARDEDNFHPTIEWLRKHVDDKIQEADLIMEPLPVLVGDEYNPVYKNSVEYKRNIIKQLLSKYEVIMAVDDEDKNCKMFEEEHIPYLQFKDPNVDVDEYKEKLKNIPNNY